MASGTNTALLSLCSAVQGALSVSWNLPCLRSYACGTGEVSFEVYWVVLVCGIPLCQPAVHHLSFTVPCVRLLFPETALAWLCRWDDSEDLASHAKGYMDFQIKAAQKACFA